MTALLPEIYLPEGMVEITNGKGYLIIVLSKPGSQCLKRLSVSTMSIYGEKNIIQLQPCPICRRSGSDVHYNRFHVSPALVVADLKYKTERTGRLTFLGRYSSIKGNQNQ